MVHRPTVGPPLVASQEALKYTSECKITLYQPHVMIHCLLLSSGLYTSTIQSCCKAISGVSLFAGSQARHLVRKSKKSSSVVLRAEESSFVSGRRLRPLELVMQRGLPLESGEKEDVKQIGGREGGREKGGGGQKKKRSLHTKEEFSSLSLQQHL